MSILLSLLIVAATGATTTDSQHPDAVAVFSCNFGEQADRDYDEWPDGWTRKKGNGFPGYLPVKIVNDGAAGERALRMQLDGGAAAGREHAPGMHRHAPPAGG